MKRACLALVVIALVAGCDKKTTQPTPTPTATPTPNPVFTSVLTPGNEVPPVTGPEATAQGTVRIELFVTRDAANVITAATANFTVTLTGFPAGAAVNIAHIHEAPAGTNSGIAVNTGLAAGEVTLTNGNGGFTKNGVNITTLAIAQRLLDGPAGFYFNVHTTANPGGVIRGQLTRTQ